MPIPRSGCSSVVLVPKYVGQTSLLFARDGESWLVPSEEIRMVNLQVKFSRLKKSLKIWNKSVFGNIFEKLKQVDREAQEALKIYDESRSPEARAKMNKKAAELVLRLKMEEDYWKQKATVRWSVEGERNSKCFQGWVKFKISKARIHSIEEEDQIISKDEEIRT